MNAATRECGDLLRPYFWLTSPNRATGGLTFAWLDEVQIILEWIARNPMIGAAVDPVPS